MQTMLYYYHRIKLEISRRNLTGKSKRLEIKQHISKYFMAQTENLKTKLKF